MAGNKTTPESKYYHAYFSGAVANSLLQISQRLVIPKGPYYNHGVPISMKPKVYCSSLYQCFPSGDRIPSTHCLMQSPAIAVMGIVSIEIQQAIQSRGCSHESVDIALSVERQRYSSSIGNWNKDMMRFFIAMIEPPRVTRSQECLPQVSRENCITLTVAGVYQLRLNGSYRKKFTNT